MVDSSFYGKNKNKNKNCWLYGEENRSMLRRNSQPVEREGLSEIDFFCFFFL